MTYTDCECCHQKFNPNILECHGIEICCTDCDYEGYFTCRYCNELKCYLCDDIFRCGRCDKHYCRDGCKREFSLDYDIVCEDCITKKELDKIEQDEIDIKEYFDNQTKRRLEIKNALSKYKLNLRKDSSLCQKYIEDGIGDLDEIVKRMCEMNFLFEYCKMKSRMDEYEDSGKSMFIFESYFQKVEYDILEEIGDYPKEWPWMDKSNAIKEKSETKKLTKQHNLY